MELFNNDKNIKKIEDLIFNLESHLQIQIQPSN